MYNYSPQLTWRDVQYITLMTARPIGDGEWVTNGVGRKGLFLQKSLLVGICHIMRKAERSGSVCRALAWGLKGC